METLSRRVDVLITAKGTESEKKRSVGTCESLRIGQVSTDFWPYGVCYSKLL